MSPRKQGLPYDEQNYQHSGSRQHAVQSSGSLRLDIASQNSSAIRHLKQRSFDRASLGSEFRTPRLYEPAGQTPS